MKHGYGASRGSRGIGEAEEGDRGGAVAFLTEAFPDVAQREFGAGEVFEDEDSVGGEGAAERFAAEKLGGEVAFAGSLGVGRVGEDDLVASRRGEAIEE